ncbi:MAG: hypothetical protein QXG08_03260 [Candidatus Methanomethyliaceae archaeon]
MLNDILVRRALERKEAFIKLRELLETIKRVVYEPNRKAEVFLFGSVAEGEHIATQAI